MIDSAMRQNAIGHLINRKTGKKEFMKKLTDTRIWVPLIVALALVGGFGLGNLLHRSTGQSDAEKKLGTILNLIRNDYVDKVDIDSLLEETFPALLQGLDPHSSYIPAKDLRGVDEELDGAFSGVGISFMMKNDTIMVVETIAGGPSEKVGIKAGDRIVTIDGEDVTNRGFSAEKVRSMLKGVQGTRVKLGIKRSNSRKILDFEVTRDEVPVSSIDAAYMLTDTIGYVKVNKFVRSTYDEFFSALADLQQLGATGYVVDLRGNTGGWMEMAILMANEFLEPGMPIVFTRGRNSREDRYVMSDRTGSFHDAELVVLIDEYSASSSEIFAGAIQDNDRGLVIGRRSFGKGLIQRRSLLPDSSAMLLTTGRYYTPSGRCIQKDYSNQTQYRNDLIDRFNHGEAFIADSIKLNTDQVFQTLNGRTVYGGGGIMPDIFVPSDTAGVTGYYINVVNAGMLQKFAIDFADSNRETLSEANDVDQLMALLPTDSDLLSRFVNFCSRNGIPARWYYINISRNLIVNQLKALIARDILGYGALHQILNSADITVIRAVKEMEEGRAANPIMPATEEKKVETAKPAATKVVAEMSDTTSATPSTPTDTVAE